MPNLVNGPKRSSWLDVLTEQAGLAALEPGARHFLARLDDVLFAAWNLGDNLVLAWTREGDELRFLHVRHYAIIEQIESGAMTAVLAGEKFLPHEKFAALLESFGSAARIVTVPVAGADMPDARLVENIISRYSVSFVRERAVLLLDAVGFSLRSPLEQVAMLNSMSYSINSAYSQLLSEHVHINFARTTTGDGFYIWNRAPGMAANVALYQLMMLILADNAVAASKAQRFPVPQLRAAFHIGEHYEFYQVEGLNPSSFGYIVGQVTIDLARMIENALPGQVLLGDFVMNWRDSRTGEMHAGTTINFVVRTANAMEGLKGAMVGEDRIKQIRCYLTGEPLPGEQFAVVRQQIQDKHGQTYGAYNAKLNIHREQSAPIYLGLQHKDLPSGASAWSVAFSGQSRGLRNHFDASRVVANIARAVRSCVDGSTKSCVGKIMLARLRSVAFSRAGIPAWALLGVGLLITLFVGLGVKHSIDANAKAHFANTCDEIVQQIRERLAFHESTLRAGVDLFAGSKEVSRSEWRAFYEKLTVNQNLGGAQSLGFVKVIRPEALQSHISAVRAEGIQDYTVRPEGSREIYAPVVYNEPFRDGNVRTLGMDGLAEPIRRAGLEQSRDTGRPAITGKITLHQEAATDIQAGFVMSAPIYRTGIPLATTEQRRLALVGWITSAFRAQDLMEDILRRRENQGTSGVAVFVYDQLQPIAVNALYRGGSPGAPDQNALFYIERKLDFNGHPWLVVFGRDPSSGGVSYMAVLLSAGAGMAISVLLFVLVLRRSSRSNPQSSQR